MANMKGFKVVYSEEEDYMSLYSAWSEESESDSEEDYNLREVYLLSKSKTGKKTLQKK